MVDGITDPDELGAGLQDASSQENAGMGLVLHESQNLTGLSDEVSPFDDTSLSELGPGVKHVSTECSFGVGVIAAGRSLDRQLVENPNSAALQVRRKYCETALGLLCDIAALSDCDSPPAGICLSAPAFNAALGMLDEPAASQRLFQQLSGPTETPVVAPTFSPPAQPYRPGTYL
ncbi:MAG TPA: hypothetical protein VK674_02800 [Candidatus Limnocylindria bacterium]|nr:hypothetical protein [Candidatus Limnocylindria bacterium]